MGDLVGMPRATDEGQTVFLPPEWVPTEEGPGILLLDDAMITRMMHVTLEFDVKAWASWAETQGVDERGINFVLTYPEIVTGRRTTPRSLVQFFDAIQGIEDLEQEIGLVQMRADGALDPEASAAFLGFVRGKLSKLVTPEAILAAKNFKKDVQAYLKKTLAADVVRVDILSALCTRVVNYVQQYPEETQ